MSEDSNYFRRRASDHVNGRPVEDHWPSLDRQSAGSGERDSFGWTSVVVEVKRGEIETVRAVRWSRGEEEIITLQFLLNGLDGSQYPVNMPPTPDTFDR